MSNIKRVKFAVNRYILDIQYLTLDYIELTLTNHVHVYTFLGE